MTGVRPLRKLDDPTTRSTFIAEVRAGNTRREAANRAGIVYPTVWRYCQDHPDFLEELLDAEADVVDNSYAVFLEIMQDPKASNADRLSAADKLAKYKSREQQRDHTIKHEHKHELEVKGDMTNEIVELQRSLEQRELPPSSPAVIDVPYKENDND